MRMAAQDSGRNHAEGVNYWLVHLMEIRRNSDHILEVQRTFLSELVKGVLSKYTSLAPPPPRAPPPRLVTGVSNSDDSGRFLFWREPAGNHSAIGQ